VSNIGGYFEAMKFIMCPIKETTEGMKVSNVGVLKGMKVSIEGGY